MKTLIFKKITALAFAAIIFASCSSGGDGTEDIEDNGDSSSSSWAKNSSSSSSSLNTTTSSSSSNNISQKPDHSSSSQNGQGDDPHGFNALRADGNDVALVSSPGDGYKPLTRDNKFDAWKIKMTTSPHTIKHVEPGKSCTKTYIANGSITSIQKMRLLQGISNNFTNLVKEVVDNNNGGQGDRTEITEFIISLVSPFVGHPSLDFTHTTCSITASDGSTTQDQRFVSWAECDNFAVGQSVNWDRCDDGSSWAVSQANNRQKYMNPEWGYDINPGTKFRPGRAENTR